MTPEEELDQLMQKCKQNAKECGNYAIRFRKTFKWLALSALVFACVFFPLGGITFTMGVQTGQWKSIVLGIILMMISVLEICNIPRDLNYADKQFHDFMKLRETSLNHLKNIQDFKQQIREGEEWRDEGKA